MKSMLSRKWLGIPLGVLVVALMVVLAGGTALAFGGFPFEKQATSTGSVTVIELVPTTLDMSLTPSVLDFSGSIVQGQVYTKTVAVVVKNLSVAGNDGGNGIIHNITIDVVGLPEGWNFTAPAFGGLLNPGASTPRQITVTSVTPLTEVGNVDLSGITVTFTVVN